MTRQMPACCANERLCKMPQASRWEINPLPPDGSWFKLRSYSILIERNSKIKQHNVLISTVIVNRIAAARTWRLKEDPMKRMVLLLWVVLAVASARPLQPMAAGSRIPHSTETPTTSAELQALASLEPIDTHTHLAKGAPSFYATLDSSPVRFYLNRSSLG
jgi:hypothetical protein